MAEHAVVVSTVIEASPAEVWADVLDISSHVTWMQDAVEIRFLTEQTEGPDTRFECDTEIGPLGAFAARPVLRRVWEHNLARLKARVERA